MWNLLLFSRTLTVSCAETAAPKKDRSSEDLPQVLIIGDSISMGYTPHVEAALEGKAVVEHNPGNAQYTAFGIENIEEWLGDTDWDLIHFNWGIWDLCYRIPSDEGLGEMDKVNGEHLASPEEYEQNLEKLVARLKKTGATLIWGSISFVPEGEPGLMVGDDIAYNEIAERVMRKHGIEIDDIHALTSTFPVDHFEAPGNVHYNEKGYERIAEQVTGYIRAALGL